MKFFVSSLIKAKKSPIGTISKWKDGKMHVKTADKKWHKKSESDDLKIGFTGTQQGMTAKQKLKIAQILSHHVKNSGLKELHVGDCIGADEEAVSIGRKVGTIKIIGHPPDNDSKRAFCKYDKMHDPLPYLDRNKKIVEKSSILVAAPGGPERLRSGTWATIRHARKQGKQIIIVNPDGSVDHEHSK
jgi:hypothetical protein